MQHKSGKSAVGTLLIGGAEGQLGQAAVRYFAKAGMRVTGSCRTGRDLELMREFVKREGLEGVELVTADLGDEGAVERLVEAAEQRHGAIEGVFNAAGGFRYGAVAEATIADYEFLMTASLKSSFLLARTCSKRMTARGFGRLVFVSSRSTLGLGEANMGLYLASKAGLNALVTSLAREVRTTGMTVNAVMPSVIDTPSNRQAMPGADTSEWVSMDALLGVVATLLGPTGAAVNGALIPITGRL